MPRIPASLLSITLFMGIVGFGIILIYKQTGRLIDDLPLYKSQALKNIDQVETFIEDQFGLRDLRLVEFLRERIKFFFEAGSDAMNEAFTNAAGIVFRVGILPVYIFLFLYYRTKLAYFILKLISREQRTVAVKVLGDFSKVVARYMGGVSTVVLILAGINTTGLFVIGVENAIVFGIISATCSFIPYFGNLIGGSIPFIFTLLTSDNPLIPLKVVVLFWLVHIFENNILSPNIVGNSLRLNPMVIIIGIVAGGTIWGIPGMFSVVPILAMLNIMSENVENLHAFSFLLGPSGTRKHALTKENIIDYWKWASNNFIRKFRKIKFRFFSVL
jgi:predicted PurR-regulated permease PerM